jgi:DNA-binding response OmpR family regulator
VWTQSGRQALELLEGGQRFDLVLCDLLMPNVGGSEVYDAFVARWPEMVANLVFMTGGTFNADATAFLERTKRPILYKPFTPAELEAAVEAHLSRVAQPRASG